MAWWFWIVGGVLLCLAEMATPGAFYLLFFGVAALVVGVLAWAGLVETTGCSFSCSRSSPSPRSSCSAGCLLKD